MRNIVLALALTLAALSTVALWTWVNATTALLPLIAFVSYVRVYTPMKRLSPQAVTVDSLCSAVPSLVGWAALAADNMSAAHKGQIWSLYERAYRDIGMHLADAAELVKKYPYILVFGDGQGIFAFIAMAKTPYGYRLSATGHDGEKPSRKAIIVKHIELLESEGYYAALSGDMEERVRRSNIENVKDPQTLEKVFGSKIRILEDGAFLKEIGDLGWKKKALYGKPIL